MQKKYFTWLGGLLIASWFFTGGLFTGPIFIGLVISYFIFRPWLKKQRLKQQVARYHQAKNKNKINIINTNLKLKLGWHKALKHLNKGLYQQLSSLNTLQVTNNTKQSLPLLPLALHDYHQLVSYLGQQPLTLTAPDFKNITVPKVNLTASQNKLLASLIAQQLVHQHLDEALLKINLLLQDPQIKAQLMHKPNNPAPEVISASNFLQSNILKINQVLLKAYKQVLSKQQQAQQAQQQQVKTKIKNILS